MTTETRQGAEFRDQAAGRGRPGLEPGDIKRLTRISPWHSSLAVGLNVAATVALIAIGLTWWTPAVVVPCIIGIAACQHGLFVLAHDAAHYRLYETRWLNDLVGALCGAGGGLSMKTYRVVHRLHHNHLYDPTLDPDIALMAGYPRGRTYLMRKLLIDLTGITAYKNYSYFFGRPAANKTTGVGLRPLDDTSPRLKAEARRDRLFVIALHAGLLAGMIAAGWWLEYLVLWLLPLLTVLQAILRLRAVLEHGAPADIASPYTASRTNHLPRLLAPLIFPHHVNYHIEHHLYPAIPHYRLPEAHRLLAEAGVLSGAEVRSIGDTIKRVFADPSEQSQAAAEPA